MGGVRVCGCVHSGGGHLVVVAAGSEKTSGGGGQGQGAPSFIKTPLCEPHARPHPGCKVKTGLLRCTRTYTFRNTHTHTIQTQMHASLPCRFFGGVSVFA